MTQANTPRVVLDGLELPASSIGLPLEIQHGRSGTDSQPDSPRLSLVWCEETAPFETGLIVDVLLDLPIAGSHDTWGSPTVPWGSPGHTWLGATIGAYQRFHGRVTEVQAVEQDGVVLEWLVTCTGNMADLGRQPITISRPAETDVQRVQAIALAGGFDLVVVGDDPVNLTADTIDKDALGALHEVAGWTGGLVWQGRDGVIHYGTRDHRSAAPQSRLPASAILDGVEWNTTLSDVLNHFVVTFGDPETQNTYRNDASINKWGFRHGEVSTKLLGDIEADEFGQTVLARRSDPFWYMSGIVVNSLDCTLEEHYQANVLTVGMGVVLPIGVTPGPIGVEDVEVWSVEGWVETWEDPGSQRLQIAVSDRQRWGAYALNRWSGQALEDWQFWLDNGSWLEQLTHGN